MLGQLLSIALDSSGSIKEETPDKLCSALVIMPAIYRFSTDNILRRLGEDSIIWVNPDNINIHVGKILSIEPKFLSTPLMKRKFGEKKKFYRSITRRSFIFSNEDIDSKEHLTNTQTYKRIANYVEHKGNFRESIWYKSLLDEINSNGESGHKKQIFHNREDLDNFFQGYVASMCESFETVGFDSTIEGVRSKCYIDRNGQLLKGPAGRHRLAFAKVLKLDRFPLLIWGVHEDWYRDRIGDKLDIPKLREELKAVAKRFS